MRAARLGPVAAIVGFLAFVEFTSGILQGYYTPLLTDIARHLGIHDADVNWLEGTQLMLSALVEGSIVYVAGTTVAATRAAAEASASARRRTSAR